MASSSDGDDFADDEESPETSFSDEQLWQEVDSYVQRFEEAWQKGGQPNIDDFLPPGDRPALYRAVLIELVEVELERRFVKCGERGRWEDYLKRYPQLAVNPTMNFVLPHPETSHVAVPEEVGGYRIEKTLGRGSFGVVYLAHDDQLSRHVAIKVPHPKLVARPEDAAPYRDEARMVASLNHSNIVPVYHVGSTPNHPFFIVSKFIKGGTLARRIRLFRPSVREAAKLVSVVAGALHHAHCQGLVHRDIKPGNILLERPARRGQPSVAYVADFGLALREKDFGKGATFVGTVPYMSPEQARGEGNRVNGRSDIFSLGAVFYELLTGVRPFPADTVEGILDQIKNADVRPPRQKEDSIPLELERICLKALARRASERYTTAKDFADDLRVFLAEAFAEAKSRAVPTPDEPPVKIVPKGLRSFEAQDADFFLELLPGPRDRYGLPDSVRFWKTRIEEMDADDTFAVGLMYGPSGCGKSSLVKAGLLPLLHKDVRAIYVEATARDTETRLLNSLRKRCSALPFHLGLKDTLAAIRRGEKIPDNKKVLVVLDQFEQWLHANGGRENRELVEAIRQCDGARVQCILMVRDDFWLAVSRFLKELEVPLLEGHNSALVDLFDLDHAKKVLVAFGRAFGKLPENLGETTKEQKQFLEQAITGLAQEGKVICVRLAVFAEMMKGKTWSPAALRAVGGTTGVGVTFLEETFSADTSPPEHRYYQKAVRPVLKALLPESGTDIRGSMRSYDELLEASGHRRSSKDFDNLIRILDSEVLLITPTDREGMEDDCGDHALHMLPTSSEELPAGNGADGHVRRKKYYQLTHDYLVHSVRDWLARKQKETRRGRAELVLADRAAVWHARPENRQLPSLSQWLQIRCLTRKNTWTPFQRKMMRRATLYHSIRGLLVGLLAVAGAFWIAHWHNQKTEFIGGLVARLVDAQIEDVPKVLSDMEPYRGSVHPKLVEIVRAPSSSAKAKLRASIALLPVDPDQMEYVYDRLLDAEPAEVRVLRDALTSHGPQLKDRLWPLVTMPKKGKEQEQLRAAAALAQFDPDPQRWGKVSGKVVENLVSVNLASLKFWTVLFRPVKAQLISPLSDVFRDRKPERAAERTLATMLIAEYGGEKTQLLADLLMDADEKQFPFLYPKLKEHGDVGVTFLKGEIDKQPNELDDEKARVQLAKRQANAAVTILRIAGPVTVWPMLKHRPDPTVRSYLIHRLGPLGADAREIIKRVDVEGDVEVRRALTLSLGAFKDAELPERPALIEWLSDIYEKEPDAGLHAAAEWVLRTLGQSDRIKQIQDRLRMAEQQILKDYRTKSGGVCRWYVNGQGQTMVVIPGPIEFIMGSPAKEPGRRQNELQFKVRIPRTFGIAAKAVTVGEYRHFKKDHPLTEHIGPIDDYPVTHVSWYEAAAYCNWLSRKEGIPPDQWCYETTDQPILGVSTVGLMGSLFGQGPLQATYGFFPWTAEITPFVKVVTKLREKYLDLAGYRLPTEAEMECATRAGAVTNRHYGESDELLEKYGWFVPNSGGRIGPVGSLKPNDFGFFDMHGNVWCWCQESRQDYPQEKGAFADKEHALDINPEKARALRGGAHTDHAPNIRSAGRWHQLPGDNSRIIGFRLARTIPGE
jgi:serine/threonine protein kinase/formylglycine-generating enzyme required for sulfatase activity